MDKPKDSQAFIANCQALIDKKEYQEAKCYFQKYRDAYKELPNLNQFDMLLDGICEKYALFDAYKQQLEETEYASAVLVKWIYYVFLKGFYEEFLEAFEKIPFHKIAQEFPVLTSVILGYKAYLNKNLDDTREYLTPFVQREYEDVLTVLSLKNELEKSAVTQYKNDFIFAKYLFDELMIPRPEMKQLIVTKECQDQTHKVNDSHDPMDRVFFIWTTEACHFSPFHRVCIERAAQAYPKASIYILSNTLNERDLKELETKVELIQYDLTVLVKDTPLESWFLSIKDTIIGNPYWFVEEADILRYLILYRFGGIYFDTDVCVIKAFKPSLINSLNFAEKKEDERFLDDIKKKGRLVAIGVLFFEKKHPFLYECLSQIPKRYDAKSWGSIGPVLMTILHDKGVVKSCKVKMKPYYFNYPITSEMPFNFISQMSEKEQSFLASCLKKSYTIHLYGSNLKDSKFGKSAKQFVVAEKGSFLVTLFDLFGLGKRLMDREKMLDYLLAKIR